MTANRPAAILLALAAAGAVCSRSLAATEAPGPLSWAYGLSSVGDIDLYSRLGFNTLYIDVSVRSGASDPRLRDLVTVAKHRGLHVIIGLPLALGRDPTDTHDPTSPLNEAYLDDVRRFAYSVVATYRDEPAVIGWGLQHHPAKVITYCDRDLRAYLRRLYPDVAQLNQAWGKRFRDFDSARLSDAKDDATQPFGIGRRSIDVAEYKRLAFEDLNAAWARAIREFDDTRPIFSGRQARPRSLVSLPDDIAYVIPDSQAFGFEVDLQTCGADAIDIARRAGRFQAIPVLDLPPLTGYEARERAQRAGLLLWWIRLAAAHGARGVAFASWPTLKAAVRTDADMAIRFGGGTPLVDGLRAELTHNRFDLRPRASAAVIYEPYAKGVSVQGQDLYGFLDDEGEGEPNRLFSAFRTSSAFGGIDVLALDDVTRVDLDPYAVLFAPQMYRTPPDALAALDGYVTRGGALVADFGFGTYESGSWLALPALAGALFGIQQFTGISNTYGAYQSQDARITGDLPWFPSLTHGENTTGDASRGPSPRAGRDTSLDTAAFSGFHATAVLGAGTRAVGITGTVYDEKAAQGLSGIFARPRGLGVCVYATTRLWAYWRSSDPVYQAFHADLLSRRPAIVVPGASTLFPGDVHVGAIEDGVWALNSGRGAVLAEMFVPDAEGHAYLGAAAQGSAELTTPEGRREGTELVSVCAQPGELVVARTAPLRVEPVAGTCVAILRTYTTQKVEVEVGGPNAHAAMARDGSLQIIPLLTGQARVTLENGAYPVPPGSRHAVEIHHPTGRTPPKTLHLTADPEGRLRFTESFSHQVVTITPVAEAARATARDEAHP